MPGGQNEWELCRRYRRVYRQMATLLSLSPDELNAKAVDHKKIYSIASRCGVFAKSDIQPLLNQGAATEDTCASIFDAVVNQTVAGLAQGHKIGRAASFTSAVR